MRDFLNRFVRSMRAVNYRMLFPLILLGLLPGVHTSLRIFYLGRMPDPGSYSIAGQLDVVNLVYEIFSEGIILPLFYFTGKTAGDREALANRVKTGLLVTFCVFGALAVLVSAFAEPLLRAVRADPSILDASARYVRIESLSNLLLMLLNFSTVVLVTLNRERYVYGLTAARAALSVLLDTFLVSTLKCSADLGVFGIGVSNVLVNGTLFLAVIAVLRREGIRVFSREKLSFSWMREFARIGGISGIESLIRNLAYMLMVVRIMNSVGEQGTYWVANGFIWGWLLVPVNGLAELIKRDCASEENAVEEKTLGYLGVTCVICLLWFVSVPLWKPFMSGVLGYADTDKLFGLVSTLIGFYVLYAFQNVFDATFYGLGKTEYMVFESVLTNTIFSGTAFVLYETGVWSPDLRGVALYFGFGVLFDSLVSLAAWLYLLRKRKTNIFSAGSPAESPLP